MDLKGVLTRAAVNRLHVLIIEIPGWDLTRMRAEKEVLSRGWALSYSPADADVLLVCGTPGTDFASLCDRVWEQLPGPRVRAKASGEEEVPAALDQAATRILDGVAQRSDAVSRNQKVSESQGKEGTSLSSMHMNHRTGACENGTTRPNHGGMDHGGMDHGGMDHGGMDHGGMDMPMPGGIGLAEGGRDRDGLNLDVLNVPFGPVLPHWPAGLVIRCALQGDIITQAAAAVLPAFSPPDSAVPAGDDDTARRVSVLRCCDGIGRLLAVAGWPQAATSAFRVRDRLLEGATMQEIAGQLCRLHRRVHRSRVLRWSLKEPDGVLETLYRSLNEVCQTAKAVHDQNAVCETLYGKAQLDGLADRLVGLDVAAARLVVAASVLNAMAVPMESHG